MSHGRLAGAGLLVGAAVIKEERRFPSGSHLKPEEAGVCFGGGHCDGG